MSPGGATSSTIELVATGSGSAPELIVVDALNMGDRDLIGAVLDGKLGGVVLRGALAPDLCARVVAVLQQAPLGCGPIAAPPFPGWTYGAVLVVSDPDLHTYLAAARAFESALEASGVDLPARFADTLLRLGGGTAVVLPRTAAGAPYAALTVRVLGPGQGVGVHSERADFPAMAGLRGVIDAHRQLSCYAPLQLGQGGGELHLYHRPPSGQEPPLGQLSETAGISALTHFGLTVVRPGVGDLLVFDGARYNHRVTPCLAGERWTVGAFIAPSLDGGRLSWS